MEVQRCMGVEVQSCRGICAGARGIREGAGAFAGTEEVQSAVEFQMWRC